MIDAAKLNSAIKPFPDNRGGFLIAALALLIGTTAIVLFWFLMEDSAWRVNINLHLLPWLGVTALVLLSPTAYLFYRKKFDPFHPLVHACWSYWFPSFIVGGIFIATEYIYPYPLSLIANPETDLVWTCVHIMTGYAGMTLGFYLPAGRKLGSYANRRLPRWDWKPNDVLIPAIVFFGVGIFFYISSFLSGVVGFSLTDTADAFSVIYYTLSFLGLEAGFLMALYIFKERQIGMEHLLAVGLLVMLLISRLSLGGNRSSMFLIVVLMGIAFAYSGRRLTAMTGIVFAGLAVLAILAGMIYGTTFRNQKGSEDRITVDQQMETVGRTFDVISTQDTGKVLNEGFVSLAERVDGITSLGVVVSNYERLAPFEAAFDLENNILQDLWISFIPRLVWANKPPTSDPRAYSDLYFNYSGNSYAITPIGDLLRNYGPIGVPLGMMVLGIFLRFVYSTLIENQKVTIGRATAYCMFLLSFSYEGFYSTIFIYGGRIIVIALITFFIADFLFIKRSSPMVGKWRV